MSAAWGMCEAYGCPLLGVHGVSGKWYCGCHFNVEPALNDAITAELHRQKDLVKFVLMKRRQGEADGAAERNLIEITREIGRQTELAPAEPHPSEVDA